VAIAAYEVLRASPRGAREPGPRATHDQKEGLLTELREGLVAIEALPEANADGYFADWRALVQRVDLTGRELKLLEHVARKMRQAGRRG
jgi:tRNA C32,U32 (ribose-2'-O)-methylase TrmJ